MFKVINYLAKILIIAYSSAFLLPLEFSEIIRGDSGDYLNPYWAPDSKTFTVEYDNKKGNYELKISRFRQGKLEWIKLFQQKKIKQGPGRRYKNKNQTNAGWIRNHEDEDYNLMFISSIGKKHKLEQTFLTNSGKLEIDFKRDLIKSEMTINKLIGDHPDFFTPSNTEIYFSSYAYDNQMVVTDIKNEKLYQVKNVEFGSILPIRSLSITPDGEQLLIVKYKEEFSDIYKAQLKENRTEVRELSQVQLPDSNFNYTKCMVSPYDDNTYILVGNSAQLQQNNECQIFLMEKDVSVASFLGYKHREESAFFRRFTSQWNYLDKKLYFLAPGNNGGKLVFWNGENVNDTSINRTNIRDFEFSPNGQLLLITTYGPDNNIYLYEISF